MKDVVVVGAGPYGLAAAAEAKAKGLDYALVGKPMKFWLESMPTFMVLRSPYIASSLYSPDGSLGLSQFCKESGQKMSRTASIPLKTYLRYVEWYVGKAQLETVPEEATRVARGADGAFEVTTASGRVLAAKNVVLAVGNPPFATIPDALKGVDRGRWSHTSQHTTFDALAGKRVLVLGAGQSAIEACWGLLQVGARVELAYPQPKLYWHDIPLRIGYPLLHLFIALPTVLEHVPYPARKALGDRVSEPTVDKWLRDKVEPRVAQHPRTTLRRVEETAEGLAVELSDGTAVRADHIVLGTGYDVDVRRLPCLDPALAGQLRVRDGYPVLDKDLQSSVAGLFFTGVPAKGRFGPTFNFIFASPAGARRVVAGVRARA